MNKTPPQVNFTLSNPIQFLALGFGSGLAPKAPGTFGTLAAIPLYLLLTMLAPLPYALVVLLMTLAGFYICGKAADDVGVTIIPLLFGMNLLAFLLPCL